MAPYFQALLDEWLETDIASTRIARVATGALAKDMRTFLDSVPHTCSNEMPDDFSHSGIIKNLICNTCDFVKSILMPALPRACKLPIVAPWSGGHVPVSFFSTSAHNGEESLKPLRVGCINPGSLGFSDLMSGSIL